MKMRSILMAVCVLVAAAIWLWWSRPEARPVAARPPAVTPVAAAALPPTSVVKAVAHNTSVLSTNKLSNRLANTTNSIGWLMKRAHAVLLENAFIDTELKQGLKIPANLQHHGDPGAYIVEARNVPDAHFQSVLAMAGAQVVSYIPNNAYLVQVTAAGAGALAGSTLVQAVLPYEPYYKVQSSLLDLAVNGQPLPGGTALTLGLFANGAAATEAAIVKLGGEIVGQDSSPFGPIVRVEPPADWTELAQLPGVELVEVAHRRQAANDLARVTLGISPDTLTNLNYLNLSGSNVMVEVNDSGIDMTHPDFTLGGNAAGGVGSGTGTRVFGDSPFSLVDTNGHGTHVAGIIAGNGAASYTLDANEPSGSLTNADFRGKAPLATLYSVGAVDGYDPFAISDYYLQSTPAQTNALISNNSWGYGEDGYDLAAASYDAATRDALPFIPGSQPVLFVFAAGNDGSGDNDGYGGVPDSIESPGTAKNVITVGALEQLRYITNIVTDEYSNKAAVWYPWTDSSSQVAYYSSRGNVGIGTEGTYGRFKPDVVVPGTFVVSTRSGQWDTNAYYNNTNDQAVTYADQTVTTNGLNGYNVSVPPNTVGVIITINPNNDTTVFPANLPIYFSATGVPTTNTFDFMTAKDGAAIPPDGAGAGYLANVLNGGFWFGIGDSTNAAVNYDVTVQVLSTNQEGNYEQVLEGMNDLLAPYYRYETGTSMAAGGASGVLALIQDFFTNQLATLPSPALMKALLINGSRPVGSYNYALTNGNNYAGWGLPNIQDSLPYAAGTNSAVSTNGPIFFADQSPTNALATGDSHTYTVYLDTNNYANYLPLQVTLAWTDPPGNPAAAIKLVNGLELVVTNLDTGDVFYGNDFPGDGNANNPWVTNTPPNIDYVNNVENVFLQPVLGGRYSITVIGRSVNVNAVTAQTNNIVQDYALVVTCGEGELSSAITSVTDNGIVSNPTGGQDITFVMTTNSPYFNQMVGASSPLLGTNTLPLGTNTIWGNPGQVVIGQTNQWHFYVVTNNYQPTTGSASDVTNAVFLTFLPGTLSVPRIGVFADSDADSTRPEADIDLFATTDPNLTNLSPITISNCINNVGDNKSSVTAGGTEFVYFTDSAPGKVYYVGVQSQDQMGSEYDFMPIFTSTPLSQNDHGNILANGLLLPSIIPDGDPVHPGVTNVFAMAIPVLANLPPTVQVANVIVTNQIWHQNFGDLFGVLSFSGTTVPLNDHDGFGNTYNAPARVYNDSRVNTNGTVHTDSPNTGLQKYIGKQAMGPWIQYQSDNALTHTGEIESFSVEIQPHQDFKRPGITVTLQPGAWFLDYVDVPPGYEQLILTATNTSTPYATPASQAIQMYEMYNQQPTFGSYDQEVLLTNCLPGTGLFGSGGDYPGNSITTGPPLPIGLYYVGLYNPSSLTQTIFLSYDLIPVPVQDYLVTNGPSIGITPDVVNDSSVFIASTQQIAAASVGVVVSGMRISDLAITLVNQTTGQRVLLMENRGGLDTNGAGTEFVYTNILNATATGGAASETNYFNTENVAGTIPLTYNFYSAPDEMTIYYGTNITPANLIWDSGMTNNPGQIPVTISVTYPPPGATTLNSTYLTIIMNQFGNADANGDQWTYTVGAQVTNFEYLTFTDDTNLATVPIKYAIPPYQLNATSTNYSLGDFDAATNGTYLAPTNVYDLFGGWTVPTNLVTVSYVLTNGGSLLAVTNSLTLSNNEVSVVTDPTVAQEPGSNYLALANGVITRSIPTVPGYIYNVTYWYRGPGIDGWWRGEGNALDSSDPENNANNGDLIGRFTFPAGEVGQAFGMINPGQVFVYAGTNAYVQIPQPPLTTSNTVNGTNVLVQSSPLDVGTGAGFTVEGWINPTNISFPQPLVEWLARVPTNAAVTNLAVVAGPFLSPINSHYYYLLGTTNWTVSEYWAEQLGGHLATVRNADEQNWIFDQFGGYGGLNRNLWIGLTNNGTTNGFGWADGETNSFVNWLTGQPNNPSGVYRYTGILGDTNSTSSLWELVSIGGLVAGSPKVNLFYGVAEVTDIQTNGVQLWVSFTNSVATNTAGQSVLTSSNGCLYANLVDTTNGNHEIMSPPGLVETNAYQHVALTYATNTGLAMLYFNGSNVLTTNLGVFIPKTTGDVLLGKDMSRRTNNAFFGALDEMSIYGRMLSAAEIQAIYLDSALATNGMTGKFDPTVTPEDGLAEAVVSINGVTNLIYGYNKQWALGSFTFTATSNSAPVQITGLEPGILLDAFAVAQAPLTNLYYQPEMTLAELVGDSTYGEWTLELWDTRTDSSTNGQLVSWQLQFTVQTNPPVVLNPEGLDTNTVPPYSTTYFSVAVPAWAQEATNIVVSATSPVDLLYNQTNEPTGSNPGDYVLLTGVTSGSNTLFAANVNPLVPTLVPGQTYYLGVRNNSAVAATVVLTVDYNMVTLTNGVPYGSVLGTNVTTDAVRYYRFDVGTNAYAATFQLLDLSSNADLVVSQGAPLPTLTSSAYGSFNPSNADESIYVLTNSSPVPLTPGAWYLGVFRRDPGPVYYSVEAHETASNAITVINLTNNVPFNYTAGPGAALTNFFCLTVTNTITATYTNMVPAVHFELYNLTGNGDLTVQTNALPLAPPFLQSSVQPGLAPELIYVTTNSTRTNLAANWYLGVPNNETNLISFTILAVIDTNGILPAFPGAEGAGLGSVGGRTGTVYHVTSTFDTGAGTLRDAVSTNNRTVVFDVSGIINLLSPLVITNSNLTIAGQTAPGGAITVAGQMTEFTNVHDVIVRDVAFRRGTADDSLQFYNVSNVIADHVSASWSSDNDLSVLNSSNVTVQWSMMADSLYVTNSPQGYGSLIRYGGGLVSFHHNLYADNYAGSPFLGDNVNLDFVDNVIDNWGRYAGLSTNDLVVNPNGATNYLNYDGNYLIAGGNTAALSVSYQATNIAFYGASVNTWIFQTNNLIDANTNGILDGGYTGWGMFTNLFTEYDIPFPQLPAVTTDEAYLAYEKVLDFAGANMSKRDWADTNIVAKVRNQTGQLIPTSPFYGMVAWWKAEGNGLDSVGTNTGYLTPLASFGTGEVGQGFNLGYPFTYIGCTSSPSLNVGAQGNGFTIEAWIYLTNVYQWHPLCEWDQGFPGGAAGTHFWLGSAYGDNGVLYANVLDTSGNSHSLRSAQNAISTNQFQHVALTYSPATGLETLYLNGAVLAQQNIGSVVPQTSYNFYIGNRPTDTPGLPTYGAYLGGVIDEIRLYKRALTTSELAAIYNMGHSGIEYYYTGATPYVDTDQDGIPDFWEKTFGSNPFVPDNNTITASGYSTLEVYDNWLAGLHAVTVTNTRVGIDLHQMFGQTGNLNFLLTNAVNGTVYLTNVLGTVTNTGTYSNTIAVFTPATNTVTGTNYYGLASFGVYVTNMDTLAYFGPETVSVAVSAVPVLNTSGFLIIPLTNALPYTNSNIGGSEYYSFYVPTNAAGVVFQEFNPTGPCTLLASYGLPLPSLSGYNYISPNPGTATNQYIVVVTNSTPVALTNGMWYLSVVNVSGGAITNAVVATLFTNVVAPKFYYPTNTTLTNILAQFPATISCVATDVDTPPLPLTYGLVNSYPTNMTISPITGVISWTPTENQGATNYTISATVANVDFTVTNTFTIVVDESNMPPIMTNLPGLLFGYPGTLTVTNTAINPNYPVTPMTYALTGPTNAAIDTNGIITWTPSLAQVGGNYTFTTTVTDTNLWAFINPQELSSTNSFLVVLLPILPPGNPGTNVVPPLGTNWFLIQVPTNALAATNALLFATLPVNLWWSTNIPPTILGAGDVELLTNSLGGTNVFTTNSNSVPVLVPGSVYALGVYNPNSVAVTNAVEVTFEYSVAPQLPNLPDVVIPAGSTLVVTNTATDTNAVTYVLTNNPPGIGATINANGIITWVTTTNTPGGNYLFNTVVKDTQTGLTAQNSFTVTVVPLLQPGVPLTNTVNGGGTNWFLVQVPTNAVEATNALLFATLPVNLWWSTNLPPSLATNLGDVELLTNTVGGTNVLTTATNPPPALVPGGWYLLGVQNTNSASVTDAIEVTFDLLVPPFNLSSIVYTNSGTTNGYLLSWYAPTNDQFHVQWISSLLATNWQVFTGVVSCATPGTTNNLFQFFDDGSRSSGLGSNRFYRLLLLNSPTNTPPYFLYTLTNRTAAVGVTMTVTNTAGDWNVPVQTVSYQAFNSLTGGNPATISGSGVITWTPSAAQAGLVNQITTVAMDTGAPLGSVTNSFIVTVTSLTVPAISSVLVNTNGVMLQWAAATNQQFHMRWTTNLDAPIMWSTFSGAITSTNGTFDFTDTNATMSAAKFYQLVSP